MAKRKNDKPIKDRLADAAEFLSSCEPGDGPVHIEPANPPRDSLAFQGDPSASIPEPFRRVKLTDYDINQARRILAKLERLDARALRIFEPQPQQQNVLASLAKELVLYGSNRSMKTTTAVFLAGMILTGAHPFLSGKAWGTPKENGRFGIVGKTQSHIGRVIYPKLFLPGAIKMIRDPDSGRWRSYRPWEEYDKAHPELARPAPPVIPPEMIKQIAWVKRAEGIPKRIVLKNGWEIYFYSSEGEPPRGDDYDWFWGDEEFLTPQWYPEIVMRLGTRKGRFMWSATAQDGGEEMYEVYERAVSQAESPNPRVQAYLFTSAENPFYDKAELELAREKLANRPDDLGARIDGKWLVAGYRVYPEFSIESHGFDLTQLQNAIVPDDWSRWAVVDPGRQFCAVLFAAMPPSGQMILLYDELYLRLCTAARFGSEMQRKMAGYHFEEILIDSKEASKHNLGDGITTKKHYYDAMQTHKLWDLVRCKGFVDGDTDVKGGIEAVHDLLRIDGRRGSAKLRVATVGTGDKRVSRLPQLELEFRQYVYKREGRNKTPSDTPAKFHDHLLDDLRYLAQRGIVYRKPQKPEPEPNFAAARWAAIKASENRQDESIHFGPTSRFITERLYVGA